MPGPGLMLSIVGHGNNNGNRPIILGRSDRATLPEFYLYYERGPDDVLRKVPRYEDAAFILPNGQKIHEYVQTHPEHTGEAAGEGGYGKVKIVDISGRKYILKYMFMRHGDPSDAINEAEMLMAVNGSPFVMRLEAAIVFHNEAYFLSPYIPGKTLDKWLTKHTAREDRVRVFNQLLDGIEYIHSKGLVHRDVKPENIWVPDDDRIPAFYLDFGISIPVGERNLYRGTRKYIPEYLEGSGPQKIEQNYHALGVIFEDAALISASLNVNIKKAGLEIANVRGHRFGGSRLTMHVTKRRSTRRTKKRGSNGQTQTKRLSS